MSQHQIDGRNPAASVLSDAAVVQAFEAGTGALFPAGGPLHIDLVGGRGPRDAGRGSGLDQQRLPHLVDATSRYNSPRHGRPRADAATPPYSLTVGVNMQFLREKSSRLQGRMRSRENERPAPQTRPPRLERARFLDLHADSGN